MSKEGDFDAFLWSYAIARSIVFFFNFFFWDVVWRSVACSVYGALGWDPCGVHHVFSVDEEFGLVVSCGI